MIKSTLSLLFTILLGSISPAQAASESADKPPLSALQQIESLQHLESLQRRADKLAFGELGASNYHLAKARTWLDMALSEYHENEGNGIVPSAIEQAEILLDALENKQTNVPMDTPRQFPGSETVRPDLWDKVDALKKLERFSCGQQPVAEAEVQLLWAGHEKLESGWSKAKPFARNAENLLKEAQTAIDNCAAQIPVIEKITLPSDALFDFGAATLEPSALWRLNRLADSIKTAKTLEGVVLIGHTDRLRKDGHLERNQLLSEQRAENIKQFLIGKGIAADKIHASGAGSSQPLVQCSTKQSKAKQMACLQPNRRVDIILRAAK